MRAADGHMLHGSATRDSLQRSQSGAHCSARKSAVPALVAQGSYGRAGVRPHGRDPSPVTLASRRRRYNAAEMRVLLYDGAHW